MSILIALLAFKVKGIELAAFIGGRYSVFIGEGPVDSGHVHCPYEGRSENIIKQIGRYFIDQLD